MQKRIVWALLFVLMPWGIGQAKETPLPVEKAPSQAQESQAKKEISQGYDLALEKGVHLLDEKRYEEAIGAFQEALQARANDTDATYFLGLTQRLFGQHESAYATLKKVDASFQKVHFDLGVAAYHLKRYDESILSLTSAGSFEIEPGARQAMVFYYLGLNYLQLERFEEAAPQFLRAGALSSELAASARYYSGVAFYRQGVFEEAQEAFDEVVEGGIEGESDSPLIQSAKGFLEEIERKSPKTKRWNLTTSLSFQQDSNVILSPENATLPSGISKESDLRTVVDLGGGFKFFETNRSAGTAQYQFYQSLHQNLDRFNVQSHDLGLTLNHRPSPERPYQFEFAYHASDALVDGNDYLRSQLFLSAVDLLKNPKRVTRVEYRFSDKDFLNSKTSANNDDRTGTNHLLGVSVKQAVSDQKIKLDNGVIYDKESTRGTDWSYQGFRVYLSVRVQPVWGLFEPTLKIEEAVRMYDNPNSISPSQEKREDLIQTYTVTLTHTFQKGLLGSLQYQANRNGSNIGAFDYQRQVTSVRAIALF